MIICSCHAITDSEIRRAVRGKLQGRPVECPAGTGCGCCRESCQKLEREERARLEEAKRQRFSV